MISIILLTSIGVLVCCILLIVGSICKKGRCCLGSSPQQDDVDDGVASPDRQGESGYNNAQTSSPDVNIYADVTVREQRATTPPEEPNRGYFSMEVLKTHPREDEQRLTPCRGSNMHNHLYVNDITPP